MSAESHTGESVFMPDDGTELSLCAGYTTQLPDVRDVNLNFYHWENGVIREVCPDGVPKPLLLGLSLFKSAGETRASLRMHEQAEEAKRRNGHG